MVNLGGMAQRKVFVIFTINVHRDLQTLNGVYGIAIQIREGPIVCTVQLLKTDVRLLHISYSQFFSVAVYSHRHWKALHGFYFQSSFGWISIQAWE